MPKRQGIPRRVLEQAKRVADESRSTKVAAQERPPKTKEKIVQALKRLHPMD